MCELNKKIIVGYKCIATAKKGITDELEFN